MTPTAKRRAMATAQAAADRVVLYRSVYPTPHLATRLLAFAILMRLEGERNAATTR